MYVMANVMIFGGELNWWWRERRKPVEGAGGAPAT
jgi:hypothetical protein